MRTEVVDEERSLREAVEIVTLGGMRISVVDRARAAELLISQARTRPRGGQPLFFTSANGEVIARAAMNPAIAALFAKADQIVADGQPLVVASRWLCRIPLPERVATTDLFHDAARLAQEHGLSFYLFGATEGENARAVAAVQAAYPRLNIIGRSHGYLSGGALEARIEEINRLAPDVLWLALGVPREQEFVRDHGHRLGNVGVIKTAGGLFNFLSGKNRRAPAWMQELGLEWLWRAALEPSRLLPRYLATNPIAVFLLLTRSR
jgi:N-acetylglucosaminyldiphosphoundecaprenol N-acetyl-beta-D-mannosaminyltransferase